MAKYGSAYATEHTMEGEVSACVIASKGSNPTGTWTAQALTNSKELEGHEKGCEESANPYRAALMECYNG